MRICLVAESYPPAVGGVEFALQKLVDGFVAKGHSVRVIAASWEGHPPGVDSCDELTIVRVRTFHFLKRFWFILSSLAAAIRGALWADVVQGSTFAGAVPAFVGGWLAGKRKALLVHEVYGRRWFRFESNFLWSIFYFLTEWIIVRLPFDNYIVPSTYTRDSLRSIGVPDPKISVIPHGNSKLGDPSIPRREVRSGLGFAESDFVFIAFGRTGVTKGFEYLVEAIPYVTARVKNAKFVLVLSGYDRRIWKRLQRGIGALPPGICTLVPPMPRGDLAGYVAASDCVVIPSLSEGFGFSALEACNAGKTVLAADAGALPEVIFGKHLFVKPGSAEAIAEGCLRVMKGEADVTPVRNFSWETTVDEYLKIYEELCHRGSQQE